MINTYILGIVWSISSINPDSRIVFRHKEKYFIQCLQKVFGGSIYEQDSRTDKQYVLKFKRDTLLNELNELGYSNRNSDKRIIPTIADKKFLQAYLEIHSKVDWQTAYTGNKKRKYKKVRIRVYGNKLLLEGINLLMHDIIRVELKTVQNCKNDTTGYISYGSQDEINMICDAFINEELRFIPYWDKISSMINEHNNSKY
jgi:hypothetical protein